jgi:hypothetical protein
MAAKDRQLAIRMSSTSTVQAPHCPWSQPFFDPVSPRCSRNASSSVVRVSRSSVWDVPFISKVTRCVTEAD